MINLRLTFPAFCGILALMECVKEVMVWLIKIH